MLSGRSADGMLIGGPPYTLAAAVTIWSDEYSVRVRDDAKDSFLPVAGAY